VEQSVAIIIYSCYLLSHNSLLTYWYHYPISRCLVIVLQWCVTSVSPVIFLARWVRYITVYKVWVRDRDGK